MTMPEPISQNKDLSFVLPPAQFATPLLRVSTTEQTVLPFELVELLDQVYFLHMLSTEPRKVLPPGKSILSVLSGARNKQEKSELDVMKDQVQDIVHRAFWDEAIESLSDPTPSSQLPRLKKLYDDLHVALSPLLPKGHIVLVTLSSPLSPTSAPLLSAVTHLREAIASLRERCAPARDADLDKLLHTLEDATPISSTPALARLVVGAVGSILEFAELMKEDLSQFVLGHADEKLIRGILRERAVVSERKLTLELWRLDKIKERWASWLQTPSTNSKNWSYRLVDALGSSTAISCPLPIRGPPDADPVHSPLLKFGNQLPPTLFFSTPSLLYTQNYLQALVIAASLQTLIQRPNPTFITRVWTLLKAEINGEPGSGETKIINLADEVISARRASQTGFDAEAEKKVRASVEWILQTHDPVFVLLQKRLLAALSAKVAEEPRPATPGSNIPERLQSGRSKGMHIRVNDDQEDVDAAVGEISVKGFEDPVLVTAIRDAVLQIKRCVDWTNSVWPDVVQESE